MMVVMLVQDMRHGTKEMSHLRDKAELMRFNGVLMEDNKIIGEYADLQSKIMYSLRQENEKKDLYITRANDLISDLSRELSYARAVVEVLKEYLKKLGEWPPKVAPPSGPAPIDPDRLAGRSEA